MQKDSQKKSLIKRVACWHVDFKVLADPYLAEK